MHHLNWKQLHSLKITKIAKSIWENNIWKYIYNLQIISKRQKIYLELPGNTVGRKEKLDKKNSLKEMFLWISVKYLKEYCQKCTLDFNAK